MHQIPKFEIYTNDFLEKVKLLKKSLPYTRHEVDKCGMHQVVITKQNDARVGLVITSGLHGIEGYVGSQFVNRFLDKHLPHINLNITDVVLFNFIDAWGMKHYRRVNEDNIDLNRNFIDDFEPKTPLNDNETLKHSKIIETKALYKELFRLFIHRNAIPELLKGQSVDKNGLFFTGSQQAYQTQLLIRKMASYAMHYDTLIVLDLHTGMGPYGELTYILDENCKGSTLEWKFKLNYPSVMKAGEGNQYHLTGDFINYLYRHYMGNDKDHFFATLEFGIHYKNVFNYIRNIKHLIEENHAYHDNNRETAQPNSIFYDYFPRRKSWWSLANTTFDNGLRGILSHYNLYHF